MFEAMQVLKGGTRIMISAHLEVLALAKELDFPVEEAMHNDDDTVATL